VGACALPPIASITRATASMAQVHTRAQPASDLRICRSSLCAEAATWCIRRARAGAASNTHVARRSISRDHADETLGWGAITQDLAFIDAAGGHATMLLEPFVESRAAALLVRIDRKSEVVRDPRH
jgi:thioesterase domain-containing protein